MEQGLEGFDSHSRKLSLEYLNFFGLVSGCLVKRGVEFCVLTRNCLQNTDYG